MDGAEELRRYLERWAKLSPAEVCAHYDRARAQIAKYVRGSVSPGPRCPSCGDHALDGHPTCGRSTCNPRHVRRLAVQPLAPLCRYCNDLAIMCRTSGARSSRTFRCELHRYTEDLDEGIEIYVRPTYEDLDLDAELLPRMRAAWRLRSKPR